jgi:phospholipid/cholesterol/gamma-HCH transport system substrate-binding protein
MVNSEHDSSGEREAGLRVRPARGLRHPVATAVGIAALVLGLAAIVHYRYGWLFVNGPQYQAAFTEISGLGQGAEVRYAGLAVGRVRRVSIDPTDDRRVLVTFRVRNGTPVRTDTRVSAISAGSRPASYLNLHPTSTRAPMAAWGTRLETQEGPTIENVLARVTLVLDRTDTLLAAAAPLAHSTFFADFGRVIARVDTLATAASRSADRWGPRLERVVQHTDQLLERTDRIVATLDSARPALGQAPAEMVATLQESRILLTELRNGVDQGGGLQAMMQNLAAASDDLARLTARLERNPLSALQRRALARKTTGPALHD